MTAAFDAAVVIVLEAEGVFSDSKLDPGGETKYGISQAAFPTVDIAALTVDQAKYLYRSGFWDKHRCGEMPWGWALAVFDGAINQGSITIPMVQRALNVVQDGFVGPETLAAMQNNNDALLSFLAFRADAYRHDANYDTFGFGWLRRIFHIAQCGEKG